MMQDRSDHRGVTMCAGSPIQGWGDRKTRTPSVITNRLFWIAVLICFSISALAQAPSSSPPVAPANGGATSQSPAPAPPGGTTPVAGEDKNLPEITTHQETDTTFKVNVNLVLVRVVVRNGQGQAIGTLKKEDLQLFDNGKPQTIARFAVEKTEMAHPAGSVADKEHPAITPVAPERYVAYLFDDLHLPPVEVASVRNAAIKHLESLAPGDRAAVYTTSGLVMQDFTADRTKLQQAIARITFSPIRSAPTTDCPYISPYEADLIVNKHDPIALQVAVGDYINCLNMNSGAGVQSVVVASAERVAKRQQRSGSPKPWRYTGRDQQDRRNARAADYCPGVAWVSFDR
jgi:hypothetical protein